MWILRVFLIWKFWTNFHIQSSLKKTCLQVLHDGRRHHLDGQVLLSLVSLLYYCTHGHCKQGEGETDNGLELICHFRMLRATRFPPLAATSTWLQLCSGLFQSSGCSSTQSWGSNKRLSYAKRGGTVVTNNFWNNFTPLTNLTLSQLSDLRMS